MQASQRRRLKVPAAASVWYVATGVVTKAVGMLMTPVFTRILTGEEYGAYTLYMSWLGLASTVALGAISQGVIYKCFQRYGRDESQPTVMLTAMAVTGAVATLALIPAVSLGGISPILVPLMLLQLLFDTVISVRTVSLRYTYSYKQIALSGALQAIGAPLLSVLLISTTGLGAYARILGLLAVTGAVAVPLAVGILRRGGAFDGERRRYLLSGSARLLPHLIAGAVISQADKLMLSFYHGEAVLARYSVAHTVGYGLVFAVGGIGAALNPWIMRKLRAGREDEVRDIAGLLTRVISQATVFLVAIAPEALRLLAPAEYSTALPAVLPIVLTTLPSFVAGLCSTVAVFSDRGAAVSAASVPAAAVNIAAGLLLIPEFRYTGAAFSLLLAHLCSMVLQLCVLKKCRLLLPVSGDKLLAALASSSILGVLVYLAYPLPWLRVLLLIPPALSAVGAVLSLKEKIADVPS